MSKLLYALAISLLISAQVSAQYIQYGNKLVGAGATGGGRMGQSIALSADSSTLIVGIPYMISNGWSGGAAIFTRQDSNWIQQAVLNPTNSIGQSRAGTSVAISADGNTAVIGAPLDNDSAGAAWIFNRTGNTWTQQAKITDNTLTASAFLGSAVSMSSDGNTCILGAPLDKDTVGSIDIFIRTGTAWSRQANLVGSGWIGQPQQGSTTAISYDGNTAAWAAATDSFGKSAVWVFKRTGTAWSQDGNKIHGVFTSNVWYPGLSQMGLALSGDGLTLAAGDYGGAHIYLKQSTWVHHQFLNSPNFGTWGPSSQGQFIALSYTGNTIAFTSPRDDYQYQLNTGRAYIFSRPAFTSNYTEKFNTTVSPDHKGTKNIQPIHTHTVSGSTTASSTGSRESAWYEEYTTYHY
jgi:hypothetical protein